MHMVTQFEDLANEIIYQILEFLGFIDAHETFVNLNQRLTNVVFNSPFPNHVDFSFRSKSIFELCYQDILRSSAYRVGSLHISNMFILYRMFPVSNQTFKFSSLKHLNLTLCHGLSLRSTLEQLNWLPQLVSLTITAKDRKHGNLDDISSYNQLSQIYHQFKSLHTFALNCPFYWAELNALPSYFPELRYLTLANLQINTQQRTDLQSSTLKHLKYLSINVNNLPFNRFQLMMRNIFDQIHTLSIMVNSGIEYLYAHQWEQLITTHLCHLRVLNINILCSLNHQRLPGNSKTLFERFHSAFWVERKWYFNHYIRKHQIGGCVVLYSSNPYRGKRFILNKSNDEDFSQIFEKNRMSSVCSLDINDREAMLTCQYYFPNVNELKISNDTLEKDEHFDLTDFKRILPLHCLTKLDIGNIYCSFPDVIELLFNAPNIRVLVIHFDANVVDSQSVQQEKSFHIVAQTNQVHYLTINQNMTLEIIQFLITFFLRMQHLEVHGQSRHLKDIVNFLLTESNRKHRYLSSLSLYDTDDPTRKITDRPTEFENLATKFSAYFEYDIGKNMFLWW